VLKCISLTLLLSVIIAFGFSTFSSLYLITNFIFSPYSFYDVNNGGSGNVSEYQQTISPTLKVLLFIETKMFLVLVGKI